MSMWMRYCYKKIHHIIIGQFYLPAMILFAKRSGATATGLCKQNHCRQRDRGSQERMQISPTSELGQIRKGMVTSTHWIGRLHRSWQEPDWITSIARISITPCFSTPHPNKYMFNPKIYNKAIYWEFLCKYILCNYLLQHPSQNLSRTEHAWFGLSLLSCKNSRFGSRM